MKPLLTLQDALDAAARMKIDPRDILLAEGGSTIRRETHWDGGARYTVWTLKEKAR